MTALIVIGCILLFFIILFGAHAFITIDVTDEFALTVRFLGIPIRILPKKPKKYKLSHYTLKKIRKLTREELKARRAAEKAKKPKLTDMIPLIAHVAGLFFSRFFGKLHIKVARIHIKVAAGDAMTAAVLYGTVNQSVQYLMAVLGKVSHVDGLKKADISIEPDFLTSSLAFDCKLTFRVSLGNILGALIKAGFAFLRGYIRIKPDPKNPAPSRLPDVPMAPDAPLCPETPDGVG